MTPDLIEDNSHLVSCVFDNVEWEEESSYRCHICLVPEDDEKFTSIVLNLPGAASCGSTEKEAIDNVRESIIGLIEVYTEHGDPIPWKDSSPEDVPDGGKTQWILVNV